MSLAALAQHPIAILATAKTGNLWIKYVLVNVLGMSGEQFFQHQDIVRYFSDSGANRRIVFHAHVHHTNALQTTLFTNNIKTISLVRNPLDIFLSLRAHVARLGTNSGVQGQILSNDPDLVRDFAQTYFLGDLAISAIWARRDAVLVRYEDLLMDPLSGFADLGRKLGVSEADIEGFAISCTSLSDIHEMRSHARPGDRGHFTSAEIDKWKRPENKAVVSILLQSPSIQSALRLWGYD